MTEPEHSPLEPGWGRQLGGYCFARGPVRLIVWETGDPERAWHWVAEHRDLKSSDGYADNPDEAKRRAQRAAVLQWLLVALETGNQPEGFPEDAAWVAELKECLDFDRYAWGVWHVGQLGDEKERTS